MSPGYALGNYKLPGYVKTCISLNFAFLNNNHRKYLIQQQQHVSGTYWEFFVVVFFCFFSPLCVITKLIVKVFCTAKMTDCPNYQVQSNIQRKMYIIPFPTLLIYLWRKILQKSPFPQNSLKGKGSQGQVLLMLSVLWQTQPYSWAGSLVSRGCKSTLVQNLANTHTSLHAKLRMAWSTAVWANGFHRSHTQVACLLQYALLTAQVPNLVFFSAFHTSWTSKCGSA